MDVRRVCGAAVGGALVLALSVSPPAVGRSADLGAECPGPVGTSARTPGMTGMTGMNGMTGMTGMMIGSEAEYLAEMIPHHREAVTAARELQRSERARMRELGASIVAGQTAGTEQMEAWLRRWHPGTRAADLRPMMRDLGELEGDALDAAFLEDMIPHHRMAVMLSQQLLRRDLAPHDDVTERATSVRDAQRAEIRTTRGLLDELRTTATSATPRHATGGRMHR